MLAEDQVRRKNTIAKTRMDRKLLCPGTLARRYGAKKNAFFRAGIVGQGTGPGRYQSTHALESAEVIVVAKDAGL
jgi:hypothetical protein